MVSRKFVIIWALLSVPLSLGLFRSALRSPFAKFRAAPPGELFEVRGRCGLTWVTLTVHFLSNSSLLQQQPPLPLKISTVPLKALAAGPPSTRRFRRVRSRGKHTAVVIADAFENWRNSNPLWRPETFSELLLLPDFVTKFAVFAVAFSSAGFVMLLFGLIYERRYSDRCGVVVQLSSFAYFLAAAQGVVVLAKVISAFNYCLKALLSEFLYELTEGAVGCSTSQFTLLPDTGAYAIALAIALLSASRCLLVSDLAASGQVSASCHPVVKKSRSGVEPVPVHSDLSSFTKGSASSERSMQVDSIPHQFETVRADLRTHGKRMSVIALLFAFVFVSFLSMLAYAVVRGIIERSLQNLLRGSQGNQVT